MATNASHDPLAIDQEKARPAAIALAVWMAIALAVVGLLLAFGSSTSALFV